MVKQPNFGDDGKNINIIINTPNASVEKISGRKQRAVPGRITRIAENSFRECEQ
jgi:hypothetical protein